MEGTALLDSVAAAPVVSNKAFDTGMMKIIIMEIPHKVYSPLALMEQTRGSSTAVGTTVAPTVKLLFLLQCLLFFIAIWAFARVSKECTAQISSYTLMMKTVAMLIAAEGYIPRVLVVETTSLISATTEHAASVHACMIV